MVAAGLAALGVIAYPALDEGATADAATVEPVGTATPASDATTPSPAAVQLAAVQDAAAEPTPEETVTPKEPAPQEPDEDEEPVEDEDDNSAWVGPPEHIPECETKLDEAGVKWAASRIPLHKTKGGYYCGAEQIVRYQSGPGKITWGGKPKVTCGVALAMARLETIVQEEAQRHFERRVKRVGHMGTYNCREMANYPGWVSEHSYANAIDIKWFQLSNGRKISVLDHYVKAGKEPTGAKGRFLRAVARRLYDEEVFAVVLTPSFDRAHRNHFHLDLARYRVDGI